MYLFIIVKSFSYNIHKLLNNVFDAPLYLFYGFNKNEQTNSMLRNN